MNIQLQRSAALITVLAFLVSGCTTLENVPLTHSDQHINRPDIKVGESVVVTKKDHSKQKFIVTSVDSDALVGKDARVGFDDMASLDVQHGEGMSKHKILIVGLTVLGVVAIAAAAGGGGGGGGY
jgi:hypothetical protein